MFEGLTTRLGAAATPETATSRRRTIAMLGSLVLLAGCTVVPKGKPEMAPRPAETESPDSERLPADAQRHRIALLLPLSGTSGAVGQSIANATTMALLDTNAQNLRITTYDTSTGADSAAAKAIADGNKLILGPLLADDVVAVASVARPAKVPMITYSNDIGVAARDVFVLGQVPGQSVARVVSFAKARGINRFAAIIPTGIYGQRASAALVKAARENGATIAGIETYDRGNTSVASAVRRLNDKGGFDAILIADGSRITLQAAPLISRKIRILGTELWSGEAGMTRNAALRGAWFAAVADGRYGQFEQSYRTRFGSAPSRLATLGYDSVLLTLKVARDWRPGTLFPTAKLYDKGGFIGLDGAFRFNASGVAERAMEVREVGSGTFTIADPAPAAFQD